MGNYNFESDLYNAKKTEVEVARLLERAMTDCEIVDIPQGYCKEYDLIILKS